MRLADDIGHGSDVDTPAIVCQTFGTCPVSVPPAPTGLTVTGKSSSTVTLAWTAVSGATGYKVLRNGTQVGTTTSISYTDTGLSASTSYTYTVEAYNSAGTSAASSSVSATTAAPGTPPNAPTGLTIGTATTTTVPLSWTASTWTNVEEGSSCSYIDNRSFTFNGADSSYTASDSVLTWAGLNGC